MLLAADRQQERLLKACIPGPTVDRLVLADALPPACLFQLQAMCHTLYAAGLNIDYYPTNFILHAATLYYIGYECNGYQEQRDFAHWGSRYWSRTPEFLAAFDK